MKKYLLIGDGESPHLLKWAKELSRYFELYLVSSRAVSPELEKIIPGENIHEFNLNPEESGGNFGYIRMIMPLRKITSNISPDFVNAHYITSHGVLAALGERPSKRKYRLILTAWGTDILVTPFKNPFYKAITRFALNRADLVTSDSKAVAHNVHKLSSTPTITFPFGIDKLPDIKADDKDPNLFFSNRTLNRNSNIEKVLEFFAGVLAQNKKARLIVANEGPLKEQLIELSRSLGISRSVDFTGFLPQDEQEEIYRKAMFYFSVPTSDALSVSLLEAMAHGCIPIVSGLHDNLEWVENGLNGVVIGEVHNADLLFEMTEKSADIFDMNRNKIADGATFPVSIKDYVEKILKSV